MSDEKSCGSCRFESMLKVKRPCRCDGCKDQSEWQAIGKGRNQPVQYQLRSAEVEKMSPEKQNVAVKAGGPHYYDNLIEPGDDE